MLAVDNREVLPTVEQECSVYSEAGMLCLHALPSRGSHWVYLLLKKGP